MSKIGTVLEFEKNRVLVMTGECDFVFIKRKPNMFIGQQVKIGENDLGFNNIFIKRVLPAAASIAAVFIAVFLLYFHSSSPDVIKDTYAFVDLDINPSVEFMIDRSNSVQKAVALNEDAKAVLEKSNIKNIPLDKAITEIIENSKVAGYVKSPDGTAVLASVALNDQFINYSGQNDSYKQNYAELLNTIKLTLNEKSDLYKIIEVMPQTQKQASKNGISMGRQTFLENAKKKGIDLSLEKVKESSVPDIIKGLESDSQVKENNPAVTVAAKETATPVFSTKPSLTPTHSAKPTLKPTPYSEKVVYDDPDDSNNTPKSAPTNAPVKLIPKVSATVGTDRITVKWNPIDVDGFQFYKVVISKNNPSPRYPDDGYLYAITDKYTTSAVIDNSSAYNGGDFGQYLTPGQKYYISVTLVYNDKKVPGNVLYLKYPGGTTNSSTTPSLTASVQSNKILLKWTPAKSQGFVYYKVVISKSNPKPKYPDDGYLTYFTEINTLSTYVDCTQGYNGGDFGGNMTPGQKYYFSITYVYDNTKVSSNVLYLTCPGG